ncbi:MAG: hypothetical protein JXX14_20730 [Deltaproteobacteria bacterium]|nr:hypothetical protein [Deltaproteobacteria bacterium]
MTIGGIRMDTDTDSDTGSDMDADGAWCGRGIYYCEGDYERKDNSDWWCSCNSAIRVWGIASRRTAR